MSDISRNARKLAEEMEKTANIRKNIVKVMKEVTLNASDVAKSSLDLQRSIYDRLSTKIVPDFSKERSKIESLEKLTKESLDKANSVYDDSLTLFANINAIEIPDLNLTPLKEKGIELVEDSTKLNTELEETLDVKNELLNNFEDNINLSDILIKRCVIFN